MTKRPTARAEPTEPLGFEAWWDSDPERKRFHPMSIARMAWQAAAAPSTEWNDAIEAAIDWLNEAGVHGGESVIRGLKR